jgi:hypothetical protein
MGNAHAEIMTSPQPVTFELDESFDTMDSMIRDASMLKRTIAFPQPRALVLPPASYEISDGCITLTEGMALYGS